MRTDPLTAFSERRNRAADLYEADHAMLDELILEKVKFRINRPDDAVFLITSRGVAQLQERIQRRCEHLSWRNDPRSVGRHPWQWLALWIGRDPETLLRKEPK